MTVIVLLLGQVPIPDVHVIEMFHKQEMAKASLSIPGDYWDPGHDFDVLDYDIGVTVDIPHDSIWAAVTIKIKALSDTLDTLRLFLNRQFKVDSIKEGERALGYMMLWHREFNVDMGRSVADGETLSIVVYYHGRPFPFNDGGLYIESSDTDSSVTYTECEPQGARNWIPCYDSPSDKATFTQRITVPAETKVVANGSLESYNTTGPWWTYTWREHYPQATYLIAFAASKHFVRKDTFALIEGKKVPVSTWMLACHDVSDKFKRTSEMLEFFSEIFPPYPFASEKYGHVHKPGNGAMENTTCTFFDTYYPWGDSDWDWGISHELAHQWWGDWLTCATWADIWLNEGFASYCEALWWEKAYGKEGYDAYVDSSLMDFYFEYGNANPIYDDPQIFSAQTYDKAGSVLHMLRQVLGDTVFFTGLKKYALDNANESVITDDFQNAIEDVSGRDLDWFFDEWIYGPGHPHYETGWKPVTPATNSSSSDLASTWQIEFAVSQMQDQTENYFPFRMPLEIGVYHSGIEEIFSFTDSTGYQRFTVETSYKPDSFLLDPHNKILKEVVYHESVDDVPDPGIGEAPLDPQAPLALSADGMFRDVLHVRFSNPSSERMSLSLYDASGRLIKSFYNGQSKEFYRVYPLADIPAGVYFLRLENSVSSERIKTIKL